MGRFTGLSLIIVGRLLLLLLAAGAVVSAFVLGREHDRAESGSVERYVCPMHPQVTSGGPDECSICRMALARVVSMPQAAAVSYSFPELESLPDYKLISRPKRRILAEQVMAPAWVEASGLVAAVLYNDEVAALSPEAHALFFRAVAPTVGYDVRLTGHSLAVRDQSTSRVLFRPRAPAPRPGEVGWVTLAAQSRDLLVVPWTAVMNSSRGPYVLVASADGHTFTKRSVQIGRVLRGFAVVLAGLRDQDRIVVGHTFFLDAERRLQSDGGETVGVVR